VSSGYAAVMASEGRSEATRESAEPPETHQAQVPGSAGAEEGQAAAFPTTKMVDPRAAGARTARTSPGVPSKERLTRDTRVPADDADRGGDAGCRRAVHRRRRDFARLEASLVAAFACTLGSCRT